MGNETPSETPNGTARAAAYGTVNEKNDSFGMTDVDAFDREIAMTTGGSSFDFFRCDCRVGHRSFSSYTYNNHFMMESLWWSPSASLPTGHVPPSYWQDVVPSDEEAEEKPQWDTDGEWIGTRTAQQLQPITSIGEGGYATVMLCVRVRSHDCQYCQSGTFFNWVVKKVPINHVVRICVQKDHANTEWAVKILRTSWTRRGLDPAAVAEVMALQELKNTNAVVHVRPPVCAAERGRGIIPFHPQSTLLCGTCGMAVGGRVCAQRSAPARARTASV